MKMILLIGLLVNAIFALMFLIIVKFGREIDNLRDQVETLEGENENS